MKKVEIRLNAAMRFIEAIFMGGAVAREFQHRSRMTKRLGKKRSGSTYRGCGKRQCARYARNRMAEQQRNSHKPGTVQPHHIFGEATP
jgi:hypothetical protein